MLKKCRDCGEEFQADEPWKVRCFPCWKEFKAAKDVQCEGKPLESGLTTWKKRATDLEQKIGDLQAALAEAHEHTHEFYENLPRLIQLCHPDKHSGSPSAQKATQWLLEVRSSRRLEKTA